MDEERDPRIFVRRAFEHFDSIIGTYCGVNGIQHNIQHKDRPESGRSMYMRDAKEHFG